MTSLEYARAAIVVGALIGAACGGSSSGAPIPDPTGTGGGAAGGAGGSGSGQGGGGGSSSSSGSGGSSSSGSGGYSGSGSGGMVGAVGSDCRRPEDCDAASAACLAPGESPGCGVCKQPTAPCNVDGDCAGRGPAVICDLDACSCSDAKSCVTGCTDGSGCGLGEFCAANHRCAPNVCAPGDHSCLPNFMCSDDGHCTRKTCDSDRDCDGACVKGMCYPRPGTCTPPAA